MASITIRGLDEQTKNLLRIRAAHRRRSMEEEARQILREALRQGEQAPTDLGARIHARFKVLGGVELEIPSREAVREPPRFRRQEPRS
jgi:plasmid stability protein